MLTGLLLSLLLSQVPCAPSDNTVICGCKQGNESACATLQDVYPELAKKLLPLVGAAKVAKDAKLGAQKSAAGAVDSGCDEPPDGGDPQCTGQLHHIISKTIFKALDRHATLRGHYRLRDPRFVTRAVDLKAHCGWEEWHRKLDHEIAEWVKDNKSATPEEFEAYLRGVYARPELRARFPNGF